MSADQLSGNVPAVNKTENVSAYTKTQNITAYTRMTSAHSSVATNFHVADVPLVLGCNAITAGAPDTLLAR